MSVNKTPEEVAAFNAVIAQAVEALMSELRARLFEEFRQEASNSGEYWIAHIEKIFEVLDCGDEFKVRLASYKLEGDALNWWKAYKQAKGDEFILTMTWVDFRDVFFTQYFPLADNKILSESTILSARKTGKPPMNL
ncbi:zinc finger, CCHC-type, Retrotransposon gag domain protein [Artemisia annua]|uniref:Zinc finger, CCHC-type, Retrotransposon gag domain protein n=1 Tax=Artemisia annua TaxID=35608 RepID=A0A2U1LHL2_ARTAN|nr:zinc finger, CCHC-type, Retrotransposon gag domain protein [Artemisia annua]